MKKEKKQKKKKKKTTNNNWRKKTNEARSRSVGNGGQDKEKWHRRELTVLCTFPIPSSFTHTHTHTHTPTQLYTIQLY